MKPNYYNTHPIKFKGKEAEWKSMEQKVKKKDKRKKKKKAVKRKEREEHIPERK